MDRQERSFEAMERSTTSAIPSNIFNKSLTSAQNGVHSALIESLLAQPIDSPTLPNIIGELANLSRASEELRDRLARDAVLRKLLEYLETKSGPATLDSTAAAIRCLGNACISNHEACKVVSCHGFSWARSLLETSVPGNSPKLQGITIKALYNLTSQSDDAQIQCYHDRIHESIILALSETSQPPGQTTAIADEDLSAAIDVLLNITAHFNDIGKDTILPNDIERGLLRCPRMLFEKLDVEDHASLLEAALTYLRSSATQTQVVEQRDVPLVWTMLSDNERKLETIDQDAMDDVKMLKALSTSLVWILSDLAAHSSFADVELRGSSFTDALVKSIVNAAPVRENGNANGGSMEPEHSQTLSTAACQILGNFVHSLSPESRAAFVQTHDIYSALLRSMAASDDGEFLHSAAGLLVQLSRPTAEFREQIGCNEHTMAAVKKLSEHPNQQLKTTALGLVRALGKDVPIVQDRFRVLAVELMAEVADAQRSDNGALGGPTMSTTPAIMDMTT